MGFYSEVHINAQEKAYVKFKEILEKHKVKFEEFDDKAICCYGHVVHAIVIDWIKWYPDFEVVKEVESLARKLRDEPYDVEGYGYKILILNEDDTHEELSNDTGEARFSDFVIKCEIHNPYATE